jgi:hypothetical protein
MSKFKHAALALAAASLMAVQAQATEVQAQSPQPMPVATFSQADINTMFEQAGKPMQLVALSGQEMKDTEGAFGLWGALGGGIVGGIGNIGYQLGAGRGWSWGSFGYSVGGGALTGFTGGAASWYVVPRVAFFGGFGAGRMGW